MSHACGSVQLCAQRLPLVAATMLLPLACSSGTNDRGLTEEALEEQSASVITTKGVDADSYVRSGAPRRNYGTATTFYSDKNDSGSVLQS